MTKFLLRISFGLLLILDLVAWTIGTIISKSFLTIIKVLRIIFSPIIAIITVIYYFGKSLIKRRSYSYVTGGWTLEDYYGGLGSEHYVFRLPDANPFITIYRVLFIKHRILQSYTIDEYAYLDKSLFDHLNATFIDYKHVKTKSWNDRNFISLQK